MRWRRWGGSSVQERAVLRQGVQERQQRRDGVLEGRIERQDLPGHLGADGPRVIVVVHMAVALEQVDAPGSRASPCRRTPRRFRGPTSPACGGSGRTHRPGATSPPRPRRPARPPGHAPPRPAPGPAAALASSCCRPTKRVSPRAALACKRRRIALAPTSSNTSTGSVSPLTGNWSQGVDLHQPFSQSEGRGRQPDTALAWRVAPCAPPDAWSGPRRSSPCAGRCQSPAPRLPQS